MNIILDEHQKEEAKSLLNKLKSLYRSKVDLEAIKDERTYKLQFEIANALDLKKGSGETDDKAVKKPILLSVLATIRSDEISKYEKDFNAMQDYKDVIENSNKISKDLIGAINNVENELEDNKAYIKEAFKDTTLLDKECLDAIAVMAKNEYETYKNDKKIANGEEVKPKKDKSELYEYISELESILSEK